MIQKAVSAAPITFTATSMTFVFMIHLLSIYDFRLLISNIRLPTSNIIHHPSSIIHLTSSIALVLPAFVRQFCGRDILPGLDGCLVETHEVLYAQGINIGIIGDALKGANVPDPNASTSAYLIWLSCSAGDVSCILVKA